MTHVPFAGRRRSQPPDDATLLASGIDALTGLLNRETLLEVLQRRTAGHQGTPLPFALLTLGLDQLDAVNEAHGRAIGDALLRAVADRLRSETRAADLAARLGGDSFAVLMPDPSAESEANGMAARLVSLIRRPFVLEGQALAIGCSIGIALHPTDAWDQAGLLRCASQALRQARQEGGGGPRRMITPHHKLAHPAWQRRIA
jgi:diguanylate cyclase (GGDEF)-like protein